MVGIDEGTELYINQFNTCGKVWGRENAPPCSLVLPLQEESLQGAMMCPGFLHWLRKP